MLFVQLYEFRLPTACLDAIARLAGLMPCTIGAEMLQPDGDRALSVKDARAYAAKHQIPMLTGEDIMKAFGL